MSDRLLADCCYGGEFQHGESDPCPQEIAAKLTPSQIGLLDDLCGCPGLFAGQYVYDGAGIEHLPSELWQRSYGGGIYVMLGLPKAFPTDLAFAVREALA